MIRAFLVIATLVTSRVAFANGIGLEIYPAFEFPVQTVNASEPVTLWVNAKIGISVGSTWEDKVSISAGLIDVRTVVTAPTGEITTPSFELFNRSIDLGILSSGDYLLRYELYGEPGGAVIGEASTSVTVVPEPSSGLASVGIAIAIAERRRRTRRARKTGH